MFDNMQEVKVPLSETKDMWSFSGKNGKSWYRLKLFVTQGKTLFQLEYYNHKVDEHLTDYFEDKIEALELCKSLEQLNGQNNAE